MAKRGVCIVTLAAATLILLSGCELLDFGAVDMLDTDLLTGRTLAESGSEAPYLRRFGTPEDSLAAQDFLLSRDLADTQITNVIESKPRIFDQLKSGERLYVSITNGFDSDAGWIRKGGRDSLYFNDGNMDKILSRKIGNNIYHYDLRNGRPTPLSKTTIDESARRYYYSYWVPRLQAYKYAGFGTPDPLGGAIDIYDAGGRLVGKLKYTRILKLPENDLLRSRITAPLGFIAGLIPAMKLEYVQLSSSGKRPNCDQSNDVVLCRERQQEFLASMNGFNQYNIYPLSNLPESEKNYDRYYPLYPTNK